MSDEHIKWTDKNFKWYIQDATVWIPEQKYVMTWSKLSHGFRVCNTRLSEVK